MAIDPLNKLADEKSGPVDIEAIASGLGVNSPGSLKRLNKISEIIFYWFQRRVVLSLSVLIIAGAAAISLFIMFNSDDEKSVEWARTTFTILVGYAAGALWPSSQSGKNR